MDEKPKPKKKLTKKQRFVRWARATGELLSGNASIHHSLVVQPPSFTSLPQETQKNIINLLPNLESAGRTINALAQVNKELNQSINNAEFSLQLIKSLSYKFNIDNETVCECFLQTKEAQRLRSLQLSLRNFCTLPATTLKNFIDVRLQGTDLNFTYKFGMTLLLFCIQYDDLLILEYLLQRGADPNLGPGETTPLIESAIFNNIRAAEFLLATGADPDLTDSSGVMTPFGAAGFRRNEKMMRLFAIHSQKKYEEEKKISS